MDLLQLRYFQAVARKEHISRAAEELRVAQPSLSRTIARLEGELGVPLFDRRGRQIRLNEYGTAFLRRVDRALGELDDARRELADVAGPDQGSLVIASETLLTVTTVLAGFRAQYPGIGIRLRQANAEEMSRQLREREVDLCVASQPITGPGLGMVRLLDEEVLLAVHPDHALAGRERVAVAELAAEQFVTTRRGHWPRELLERLFAAEGLRPVIACEGDEPAATADLSRLPGVADHPARRGRGLPRGVQAVVAAGLAALSGARERVRGRAAVRAVEAADVGGGRGGPAAVRGLHREVGRQPWLVYGQLTVEQAVSQVDSGTLLVSFVAFSGSSWRWRWPTGC